MNNRKNTTTTTRLDQRGLSNGAAKPRRLNSGIPSSTQTSRAIQAPAHCVSGNSEAGGNAAAAEKGMGKRKREGKGERSNLWEVAVYGQ
jgi:hypothetical protein